MFLQPDLGPAPEVVHGKAIGMHEWMGFINSEGRVQNVKELKQLIHNGVSQPLEWQCWSFLAAESCITKHKYDK